MTNVANAVESAEHMVTVINEKMVMRDTGMDGPECLMYHKACDLLNSWFDYNNKILKAYTSQLEADLPEEVDDNDLE